MENITLAVDNINKLIKNDKYAAYQSFIDLYSICKQEKKLSKLAHFHIKLINTDNLTNVALQYKALILLTKLYERENNYFYFTTKLFLARFFTRINEYSKAIKYISSAYNYFISINDIIKILQTYSCKGLLYLKIRQLDSALKIFEEGLSFLKKSKNRISESDYNQQLMVYTYNLSLCTLYQEKYIESEEYILNCLVVSKNLQNNLNYFNLKNAQIHVKLKLDKTEEIPSIITELEAIESIEKSKNYALLLSVKGIYCEHIGLLDQAADYYKKALKYGEKFYKIGSPNNNKIVEAGLYLALKRKHSEDIAFYTELNQKIKDVQYNETLYFAELSLQEVDDLDEFALEKRQLEEISYILGHDLKTPIRVVKNMADIISQDPESASELIPKIVENSREALELINATLNFSKLALDFNPFKKVSMSNVVNNVMVQLDAIVKKHNAQFKIEDLPIVYGNYSLLNQLFTHLISNAIVYSKNKVFIEISAELENNFHVIKVKDNGIGIPETELQKIFQLFKKSTLNSNKQGVGIGLSVCKKIIQIHKGSIYVESEVNKGTTFFVKIPEH